jgi:hypothetical protein
MGNATPLFEEMIVVHQEDQRAQARMDLGLKNIFALCNCVSTTSKNHQMKPSIGHD